MNIDLLVTKNNEAGLVCDFISHSPIAGVIYDAQTRQLSFEYADMDTLDFNIPVEDSIAETLLYTSTIQIGAIVEGHVQLSRQVSLMILNDPYGNNIQMPRAASNSVAAFEGFLKDCVAGQPIHRDNLEADIDSANSVVSGINRSVLAFAPHLQRQRMLEAKHAHQPQGPLPSTPALGGMGSGMTGGISGSQGGGRFTGQQTPNHRPRKSGHNDDDQ